MDNYNLSYLYQAIGYQFKDVSLLKQAMSHRSAGPINNERFEFLGDSILSFVIANDLIQRFPNKSEGELSRLRAHLVKGDTLADVALEINLGDYLYLGQGELKSGGFRRKSILADALEALFAAIYLDSDITTSQTVILHLFKKRLNDKQLDEQIIDAKTMLQEWLQGHKKALPNYKLTEVTGEVHDQVFHVNCEVSKPTLITEGSGPSRRKAEQQAAKAMLDILINR